MNSMILTKEELKELTGYERPEAIKKCLRDHGIPYIEQKDLTPAVTWDMVKMIEKKEQNKSGWQLG